MQEWALKYALIVYHPLGTRNARRKQLILRSLPMEPDTQTYTTTHTGQSPEQ